MVVIKNKNSNTLVSGTNDDDSIQNGGYWYENGVEESHYVEDVTIKAGTGNDSIKNHGSDVIIDAGAGNDSIYSDYRATIYGGDGNDTINSDAGYLDGCAGDDIICLPWGVFYSTSIIGGEGNDTIYDYITKGISRKQLFKYDSGDGNDVIYGFSEKDMLQIGDGAESYSIVESGNDVIVKVGDGTITFKNVFATTDSLNINSDNIKITEHKFFSLTDKNDYIQNIRNDTTIYGGAGNDTIYSEGDNSSLVGGTGDDSICNGRSNCYGGSNVEIIGGAGNDYIYNSDRNKNSTILGGDGDDTIYSEGGTIDGGKGSDYIDNDSSYAIINGGDGNDSISNWNDDFGSNSSISGGAGNDSVWNLGSDVTISGGVGNDSIFNACDQYNETTYYDDLDGSNVLFEYNSGDGNDIVYGFKDNSTLSINGNYSSLTSGSDIIFTVGTGKITLVGAASLSKVNVKGTKTSNETNKWTISGTTAKYGTSSKTLVTVKGVKSVDGLKVNDKVVTVSKPSLGTSKITISGDGYILALADDVPKSTTKKAVWSLSGTTATYKSAGATTGYSLASNGKLITYSKGTAATSLATITGAKATKGLSVSGNKITLKNSALKNKVTVSGSYEFNFASDYKKATITGSKKADTLTVNGSKVSINGGAGNDTIKIFGSSNTITGGDGKDVFIYNSGNNIITDYVAEDKISIAGAANVTTSGKDVIFNEKLTVKGAADKTVTYYDTSGEHNYIYSQNPYTINAAGTGITLSSSFSDKKFKAENYGENLVTIDATAATQGVDIMGNDNSNKIIGGNGNDTLEGIGGNDTLTGGTGADVFVYYNDEGKDVITDYEEKDTIQIASGAAQISTSGRNVIFKVGKGSITVKNAAKTGITYIDEDDFEHNSLNGKEMVKISGETAVINKKYWKKIFEIDKYGDGLKNIDASATTGDIKITGNAQANRIISGSGKSTLTGGAGNDTLYGGDGENVFVYSKGDGNDLIYNYAAGDKISLASGNVGKTTVKGDTVIFTVGKGKISLSGAADKDITIIEDGTQKTIPYTARNVAESWFTADDDNFAVYDNQISSIVENPSADYSVLQKETALNANSILSAVSCSGKYSDGVSKIKFSLT